MTVAELIVELQRQPQHAAVKVLIPKARVKKPIEADRVIWEGNYVLIESK